MKNKIIFIIGLILIGLLSYYGSYRAYLSSHSKTNQLQITPIENQNRSILDNEEKQSYYLIQKEGGYLNVYKMPEKEIYESIEINSLWIHGEEEALDKGVELNDLSEVYEFFENRMS